MLANGGRRKRIKQKLKKKNAEICTLRFKVKTQEGGKEVNYKKMRVRQLKQILNDRGVACVGCMSKDEYIRRVKETAHMGT